MDHYCFDTGAFMNSWNLRYPIEVFPTLWERLADCVADKTIISPYEVYREIQDQKDPLYKWTKDQKAAFYEVDAALGESLSQVYEVPHFRRMVETGRNKADPWVVALARITGRTVVTEEGRSTNPIKKPKLPNVCEHFGIRHIPFAQFLRETGWRF